MNDDLLAAVEGLVEPSRVGLWREESKVREWHDVPAIWDQLLEAVQRNGGAGNGATSSAAQPTISTAVVALIIEITDRTTKAAIAVVGKSRGNVPDNLRAITATIKESREVKVWIEDIEKWTAEARTRLQLDPPHAKSARGAKCPECKASVSYTHQDGENIRQPALSIHWVGPDDRDYHGDEEWKVRAVECRACSTAWFRGEQLDALIGMMLAANATQETMTDTVPPRRRQRRRLG